MTWGFYKGVFVLCMPRLGDNIVQYATIQINKEKKKATSQSEYISPPPPPSRSRRGRYRIPRVLKFRRKPADALE